MTAVLVTLDGQVRDLGEPLLRADDLAALRGDGMFETIRVVAGAPHNLELHLARFARSAVALDLTVDLDRWRAAIATACGEWTHDGEGMLRLICSRGAETGGPTTGYVLIKPVAARIMAARRDGVSAIVLPRGLSTECADSPWLLLGAKTLSYATNMAALRYAAQHGADDVIFVSTDGYLLEGPRSTVVIARGRTLLTPPRDVGILAGTTQEALFAAATDFTCEYARLTVDDLHTADGIWLVSSVSLAARVHTLDGRHLPEPPQAARIAELVAGL